MIKEGKRFQKLGIASVQAVVVFLISLFVSYLPSTDLTLQGVVILTVLHLFTFYIGDYYANFIGRGYLQEFIQTMKYSIFYAFVISMSAFMLENRFVISRRGMFYFLVFNFIVIYLLNTSIKHYRLSIYPQLKSSKKILLLTEGHLLEAILDQTGDGVALGGEFVALALFDDAEAESEIQQVPKEEVVQFATREVIDEVFIHLPGEKYEISPLISQFEYMGIVVHLTLSGLGLTNIGQKKVQQLSGLNVITFSTQFYSLSHIVAKRVLDVLGAIVGLFICAIVALVIVPLIKKDGGPAIFVQDRVGKNGRIFKFYKFRSMYIDAEERKKDLLKHNQMQGGMFKMDNDPRITPIGHFIRKNSLDELPQFYNVLIGDMSLVGTRPPTKEEYEQYTPEQKRRLSFKPGITGLWQVSGRSEITNFDDVVKLDVAYIDGWTIWDDIKILLKTIKVVVTKDGAK